jgi:hypothetical protein
MRSLVLREEHEVQILRSVFYLYLGEDEVSVEWKVLHNEKFLIDEIHLVCYEKEHQRDC